MIDHFTHGLLTPAISFALSCIGCAAGLSCTARAQVVTGRMRKTWLWLGALAIGGTGIWVMHFVAMLGFSIDGAEIRYDVPLTIASAVLAVVVVAAGLFLVDRSRNRIGTLLAGGAITGLGVASMHYLGMRAMHTDVAVGYDPLLVALSLVIAVVAASAGLWLAVNVRGFLAGTGAALLMGVAVSGMHYTGMAAMRVTDGAHPGHAATEPSGITAAELIAPLAIFLVVSTTALVTTVMLARTPGEIEADRRFDDWRDDLRRSAEQPAPANEFARPTSVSAPER